jgi:hypothetical protein
MFVTHRLFKHPLQMDAGSTVWTSMEIALHWPWFIATVRRDDDEPRRTFALGRATDLLLIAEQAPLGRLVSLQLLLPPLTACGVWRTVPLVRIERCHEPSGAAPYPVVTTPDGMVYGGVPIAEFCRTGKELVLVVELELS